MDQTASFDTQAIPRGGIIVEISWFLHFFLRFLTCGATPWARVANFVKKPPLIFIVSYLELNGFNASMWVSWSPSDPKKSQCTDQFIQIHQICVKKQGHDNHNKFEVSLHFWPIWPTVGRPERILDKSNRKAPTKWYNLKVGRKVVVFFFCLYLLWPSFIIEEARLGLG